MLVLLRQSAKLTEDSCSSGMFQSCNFGTSECPEVASALVRGIFELFDVHVVVNFLFQLIFVFPLFKIH